MMSVVVLSWGRSSLILVSGRWFPPWMIGIGYVLLWYSYVGFYVCPDSLSWIDNMWAL
jgi:hypothetical protein